MFMTAGHRAQQEAERYGVAEYLAKPFDLDALLRVVARFVS
jgi:DNA-binding NtrC family response regulator